MREAEEVERTWTLSSVRSHTPRPTVGAHELDGPRLLGMQGQPVFLPPDASALPGSPPIHTRPQARSAATALAAGQPYSSNPAFSLFISLRRINAAGNDILRNSGLFIVDTEGAVHEPSGFRHPLEVEAIGRQLAADLGVPFEMR
ncbi:MAG: hypothetical protein ACRBN8_44360 [Nannocystales bacterium]